MKLIIDIPEEEYKRMKEQSMFGKVDIWKQAIKNSTPLDDVTTVIRNKYDSIPWRYNDNDDGWIEALEWSLEVIENILSKTESEDT